MYYHKVLNTKYELKKQKNRVDIKWSYKFLQSIILYLLKMFVQIIINISVEQKCTKHRNIVI